MLVDALATLTGRRWQCLCVGSLERDPAFVASLRRRAFDGGLNGRLRFSGALPEEDLARSYGAADLLVLPSRSETYGMVVTEALARGLPVVAADVGGVPEAMGHGADGTRPGVLVPPERPGRAGRRAARLARRRRSAPAAAAGGARAARVARRLVGDDLRRRRRPGEGGVTDGRGDPGQPGLARPARARGRRGPLARRSSTSSGAGFRPTAAGRSTISPAAAARWDDGSRRSCPGRSAGSCTTATQTCWHWPRRRRRDVAIETRLSDVTRLEPDDLAGATLITASALLDLLTRDELTRLIDACAGAGCPVLFALSVTGRVQLLPADPLDARIAAAFNDAPAPPDAARTPARPGCGGSRRRGLPRDRSRGRRPARARGGSGAAERDLAVEWLTGWIDAACEQEPELDAEADLYRRRRLHEAAAGALAVTVGHADLLVLP